MIAEPRQEYKVSVVREAIEEAVAHLSWVDTVCQACGGERRLHGWDGCPRCCGRGEEPPYVAFIPGARPTVRLLRAAWLSLPKCLVCGAEDGQSGRVLVRQYMAPLWRLGHVGTEWSEPVCTFCRRHPSISVFEEF